MVADGITMAAGTAACPGSIGAGCGAAALAGINAATNVDRIVAGAKQAVTAIPGETYGARAISSVTGASPAAAETIYGLSTLGLGFGASRLNATGDVRQPIAFSEERYEGGSNLDAADGEATTNPLTGGVNHESERLAALGIPKNRDIWRPTQVDMDRAAFKVIVGEPKFTAGGVPKGTIFDGTLGRNLEIKGGSSMLDSSYQLRLQVYRSLKADTPLTLVTSGVLTGKPQ